MATDPATATVFEISKHFAGSMEGTVRMGVRTVHNHRAIYMEMDKDVAARPDRRPLYEAVMGDRFCLALMPKGSLIRLWDVKTSNRTIIVVEGADGSPAAAWPEMRDLIEWAPRILILSNPPSIQRSKHLLEIANLCGKLLVIETTEKRVNDWIAALGPLPHGKLRKLGAGDTQIVNIAAA